MADGRRPTLGDLPGAGLSGRPGGGAARPHTKCTDDKIRDIAQAVKAGNHVGVVCRHAGISTGTWQRWMTEGRKVEARYIEIYDGPGDYDEIDAALNDFEAALTDAQIQYLKFFREVEKAECEAEIRLVTQWNLAAKDDWRAGASFLAKRHPSRWAESTQVEVSGPAGGPVEVAQAPGDIVRALATNPAAREAAKQLLAATVGTSVPGMHVDPEDDEDDAMVLDSEGFAVKDFDGAGDIGDEEVEPGDT